MNRCTYTFAIRGETRRRRIGSLINQTFPYCLEETNYIRRAQLIIIPSTHSTVRLRAHYVSLKQRVIELIVQNRYCFGKRSLLLEKPREFVNSLTIVKLLV